MEQFATGFWGCYFGVTCLMLAGSAFAYTRSVRRLALNAAWWVLASVFFVLAFLGALPMDDPEMQMRFLAHVAVVVAGVLSYLLLSVLGTVRRLETRQRVVGGLVLLVAAVMTVGWLLLPLQALVLGIAAACLLALAGLGLAVRSALIGDRLAWMASFGVFFMLVALVGLAWIAIDRAQVHWQVHAVSAVAATAYLVCMAIVLWSRYSFLIVLHEVMAQGPSYDPVTRMHRYTQAGHMTSGAFKYSRDDHVPLGIIVVSIGNLYTLEKLYGLPAVNHAVFVCAGRLKDTVPAYAELGRLADDGFLLLVRHCKDSGRLIELAHAVKARLSKSMVLTTGVPAGLPDNQQTRWAADVGVGVLRVPRADAHATTTVDKARGLSRTAWSFPSRVAWYDEKSGEITGMPTLALS